MKHLTSFAGRLKWARLRYWERFAEDMTQSRLGSLVGKGRAAVSNWESGANDPPQKTKEAIARILRVDPAWLMLGLGDAYEGANWSPGRRARGEAAP